MDELKTPTKQQMFPWLTAEQIKKIEDYTSNLSWIEQQQKQQALYRAYMDKKQNENISKNRVMTENELYQKSLTEKDPKQKNYLQSNVRQEQLADLVKVKYNLREDAPTQDVINCLIQDANDMGVSIDSLNAYLDKGDETFLYEMWFKEKKEEPSLWNAAWVALAWAWWVAAVETAVNKTWKGLQKLWEGLYKSTIDQSIREAREIQRAWANLKDAKIAVQDAKQELKTAKKLWEGVEQAQADLEAAKKNLKTAEAKKVVTKADTAMEYNVWEGLTEWWSDESRGIQAKSKANQIFKKTINPALEKSTSTINVQGLIDDLAEDIQDLAKNDPDKIKAYEDALGSLKESYSDGKFANYSLKDSQTLKSGLQGRTPQKFFKWNEVTNELQELKGILSGKLKNAVHWALTKELGQDTAKLYKDWANLTEYADDLASASTKWPSKWGFWGFMDWLSNKADPIKQKAWLLLSKAWKGMQKVAPWVAEKAVEGVWDVFNYIVKNGKKFLKWAAKWATMLKVADPNGLMDMLREAPWTIWEAAKSFWDTSPAIVVNDLLTSISDAKDEWNDMSDEEKITTIKEQAKALWYNMSDEDAQKSYNEWKKNHKDWKFWMFDSMGDIPIYIDGKEVNQEEVQGRAWAKSLWLSKVIEV